MTAFLASPNQGEINSFLNGKRLLIIADIDLKDIEKMRRILNKYEDILALLEDEEPQS